MLPLPKLHNDTLHRPPWGQVDGQPLLNLQFPKSVSDHSNDLVGIGDIHGRHERDALGVTPFLDDEGGLRKPLGDASFQLVDCESIR